MQRSSSGNTHSDNLREFLQTRVRCSTSHGAQGVYVSRYKHIQKPTTPHRLVIRKTKFKQKRSRAGRKKKPVTGRGANKMTRVTLDFQRGLIQDAEPKSKRSIMVRPQSEHSTRGYQYKQVSFLNLKNMYLEKLSKIN